MCKQLGLLAVVVSMSLPGTLTLSNSTLSGNSVQAPSGTAAGGGVAFLGGSGTMTNSIVAGNTGALVADCYNCGTQAINNLIGVAVSLGGLALNGGPTETMLPLIGSAAIGAGTYQSGEPTTDQRGYARPGSGAIDAGAAQVSGNGATITSLTPNTGLVAGGNTVMIAGTGFTGATAVYFGTNSVIPTTINSDGTSITVTAPSGTAGAVAVVVVTPAGISASATYTYSALTVTAANSAVALTVGAAAPFDTVTVTGGTGSYTYSISPTTLPAGLSFVASTGAITGTPSAISVAASYTVTATDSSTNVSNSASFTLSVGQGTPTITTPPMASEITYGQTLASSTLTGGVASIGGTSVLGTFAWTTSSTKPGAGTPTESVTFTPADTTDYTTATGTVSLTVNKATPTITTPPTASAITYGQTLASSTLSGGVGSVDGTFAWTTSSTKPTAAGTPSYSITFTPTDVTDYNTATGTASVLVNPASQTVTFTQPTSPITYGSANTVTLSATGGASDNAVTFTVASGPGSIIGKVLTITGAGTIVGQREPDGQHELRRRHAGAAQPRGEQSQLYAHRPCNAAGKGGRCPGGHDPGDGLRASTAELGSRRRATTSATP